MSQDKKIDHLEAKCVENAEFYTKLKSRVDIALNTTLPGLTKTLATLRNDFERSQFSMLEIQKKLTENANSNETISLKLAKFNELWNELSNTSRKSHDLLEKMDKLEIGMKKEYDKLYSKILMIENSIEANKEENKAYIKNANVELNKQLEKKNLEQFEKFQKNVQEKLDYVETISKEKLEREKRLMVETVSSTNEKMNKISLDLENSILKSVNNEIQLKIIEKKLENIYLIIKKLEMMAR